MNINKCRGITLIELMIAMVISLVLGWGVIDIFNSNSQTYRVQEALSRIQENGRFALDFMSRDTRMAGYFGCATSNATPTVTVWIDWNKPNYSSAVKNGLTNLDVASFDGTQAVHAISYTNEAAMVGSPDLALLNAQGMTFDGSEGSLVENTDVLIMRRSSSCPGSNVLEQNAASASIKIETNQCGIKQNDIVMVSSCERMDIFGVSNTPNGSGNAINIAHGGNWNYDATLGGATFPPGSSISRMHHDIYYIGVGESEQPALFRRSLGTLTANSATLVNHELVEGIENLSLSFGQDRITPLDGAADIFASAPDITTYGLAQAPPTSLKAMFDDVVAVRIELTVRSLVDNVASELSPQGDKRLRRNFTSTVTIRNRAGS